METSSERIILTLPESDLPAKQKETTLVRRGAFVFSLFLIMLSLTVHVGLIAAFCDFVCDGETFQSFMLSSVLPPFTKKEAFSEEEKTDIQEAITPDETKPADTPSPSPETEKTSVSMNLAAQGEKGFSLKNETTYNPDLDVLFNSPNPIPKTTELYEKYTEDEPLVLIYHTHGTESYNDTNDTGAYRSDDPERNMVAVGKVLADTIEANGIKVIHLTEMFDAASYNTAYNKSHSAVKKIMDEYPSIQYVLDIHRDSITDQNGSCVSADFTYNDITAAQIMFVVGTDEGGSGHTEWRRNMTTALHLQARMASTAPSSVRPVNLRKASFYQDTSPGAMLVEIGTSGNTLIEAKRSAVIFGHTLSAYITGKEPLLTIDELRENIE